MFWRKIIFIFLSGLFPGCWCGADGMPEPMFQARMLSQEAAMQSAMATEDTLNAQGGD